MTAFPFPADGQNINTMETVKSLGVKSDKDLSFEDHITSSMLYSAQEITSCWVEIELLP